jgi:hypothetical protein
MNDERGTGLGYHLAAECRIQGCSSHKFNNNSNPSSNPLADHPAVLSYRESGVQTDDLASFIESFASLRANRIKKIGHEQYAHATGQKFEAFSVQDTVRELVEELADAGNYIDFLAIKLLNLVSTIEQTELYCE